ncbi:MAG: hypothetical protein ACFFCZ_13030 [Promethearchaeota archaeon]
MRKIWLLVGTFDAVCLYGAAQSYSLLAVVLGHLGVLLPAAIFTFMLFFTRKEELEEKGKILLGIGGTTLGLAAIVVINLLFLLYTVSDNLIVELGGSIWAIIALGSLIIYPFLPVFIGQEVEQIFYSDITKLLEEHLDTKKLEERFDDDTHLLDKLEEMLKEYLPAIYRFYSEGTIHLELRPLAYYIYNQGRLIAPQVRSFLFKSVKTGSETE